MNLLNAAHMLGYGGIWLTGESCHDPEVKAAIGLAASDFVAGWIYIGTPRGDLDTRDRPEPSQVLGHWRGTAA